MGASRERHVRDLSKVYLGDMFVGLFSVAGLSPFQLADKEEEMSHAPTHKLMSVHTVIKKPTAKPTPTHSVLHSAAPIQIQHSIEDSFLGFNKAGFRNYTGAGYNDGYYSPDAGHRFPKFAHGWAYQ